MLYGQDGISMYERVEMIAKLSGAAMNLSAINASVQEKEVTKMISRLAQEDQPKGEGADGLYPKAD